jgi:hypothetical protein
MLVGSLALGQGCTVRSVTLSRRAGNPRNRQIKTSVLAFQRPYPARPADLCANLDVADVDLVSGTSLYDATSRLTTPSSSLLLAFFIRPLVFASHRASRRRAEKSVHGDSEFQKLVGAYPSTGIWRSQIQGSYDLYGERKHVLMLLRVCCGLGQTVEKDFRRWA